MPYMKFLSVRSDICRQLPSDSTSRWTPLPLTMQFPLLGLARDFHPLDNAHAERTHKSPEHNALGFLLYIKAIANMSLLRLLADVSQDTAVYVENVTVYEVRGIAGEEHYRTHQVLRCTPTCSRSLSYNEAVERMT